MLRSVLLGPAKTTQIEKCLPSASSGIGCRGLPAVGRSRRPAPLLDVEEGDCLKERWLLHRIHLARNDQALEYELAMCKLHEPPASENNNRLK
jgi:hypothetical protein